MKKYIYFTHMSIYILNKFDFLICFSSFLNFFLTGVNLILEIQVLGGDSSAAIFLNESMVKGSDLDTTIVFSALWCMR